MRYLSLCSGIEAASVAWDPLGWDPVAFAEIDAFPSAVLKHHYPDVPNLGDITKFKEWPDLGTVDLICGGTPCQSFSVAGLRKGLADPRGNLSLTFLAIVDRYRPRYVLWENVPGVLSSDGGRDFAAFLGGLGQLGYGWCYRVLDAQYVRVDGLGRAVPQRRRRVFVVGYLGDWRRAAAVLSEPESVLGDTPPRREAGQGTATTTKVGFGGGRTSGSLDVAARLAAHGVRQDFEVETFIAHSLRAEGFDASEDGTGRGTPLVPIAFSAKDHGADAMDNLSPTLRAGGHHTSHANAGVMPAIAIQKRAIRQDGAADTLEARQVTQAVAFDMRGREGGAQFEGPHDTANIRAASGGSSRSYVAGWAVRRLTPVECARLQGFPDDYLDILYRGKPAADGPKYKALGNSWAVNCARWIGRRIQMVEEIAAILESRRAA
jgi:DNA (cytosine-5)-methyltransferase 1